MDVHFHGVRGSTPAPGLAFARYGGHTSCVSIARPGQPPALILDAGTGLRTVTPLLHGAPFDGTILLGHLHWDHVHGLPFFQAGCRPDARVDVVLPAPDGDALATLARGLSPPHFPVGPADLGPGWSFTATSPGRQAVEGYDVLALEIPHKGGQTFGFRISDGDHAVAYLSDHWPLSIGPGADGLGAIHEVALELAAGVDLLIHDAQFLASQFPGVSYLGHSSVEYAIALAAEAGARRLALFHHAPDRTDTELDAIAQSVRTAPVETFVAAEGTVETTQRRDQQIVRHF
jgi:phosphoribosyl 1,2-cyclic phosphodiesterase